MCAALSEAHQIVRAFWLGAAFQWPQAGERILNRWRWGETLARIGAWELSAHRPGRWPVLTRCQKHEQQSENGAHQPRTLHQSGLGHLYRQLHTV